MKHLFIPYELAVIAKEKGFDEPCLTYYLDKELMLGWITDKPYQATHFDNMEDGAERIIAPLTT